MKNLNIIILDKDSCSIIDLTNSNEYASIIIENQENEVNINIESKEIALELSNIFKQAAEMLELK